MMIDPPGLRELYNSISHLDLNDSDRTEILASLTNLVPQLTASCSTKDTVDITIIPQFASHLARLITPPSDIVDYDKTSEEPVSEATAAAATTTGNIAYYGLTALSHLYTLIPPTATIDPGVLIGIIAYTNASDPWTTPSNANLSQTILSQFESQSKSTSFIIKDVFTEFVRPLFLKTKKLESITTAGRKAMPSSAPPARFDASRELDHENMPWRYAIPYAATVLQWSVQNIAEEDIKPNLHLILPPLLHLLDTTSLALRRRGLLILPLLMRKMTPQVLTQTGLGSVFEDAIVPSMMYLPTLTPLPESISIVKTSWEALIVLHETLFLAPSRPELSKPLILHTKIPLEKADSKLPSQPPCIKFLLSHLREEWFQAWSYTYPSHPLLLSLLLHILSILIPRLGIYTTTHLKDILPILSTLLLDPFILSTSEGRGMYREAMHVMRELVLACWMRIGSNEGTRMEVLGLLVGVWRALDEREGKSHDSTAEELSSMLGVVGRVFVKAVEAGDVGVVERFKSDLARLVEVDKRIGDLFGLKKTA